MSAKTDPPKVSLTIRTPHKRGRPKKYSTEQARLDAIRQQKREYKEREKLRKAMQLKMMQDQIKTENEAFNALHNNKDGENEIKIPIINTQNE